ncbi:hypothetical protein PVAND_004093 [Polypedilum vanderplanki]|uniref:Phospholipase DDHD2 n=1 Tax=Polypedilum vanderplanki TaxID=319348 RepID=A0A9J6BW45_POLVA|nr:hypothetical protein PVAND_004093 [Polypedilum vanderplanki]
MSSKENVIEEDVATSEFDKGRLLRHWFYEHILHGKKRWTPFSFIDSQALEEAFQNNNNGKENRIVTTDQGRFEVNIDERLRQPVYWTEEATQVRRASWFYKLDSSWFPYEEGIAELLESEYQEAIASNEWHRKIDLPNKEQVVFHDPNVMVHFQQQLTSDSWGSPQLNSIAKPRVVKRGIDDFHIDEGDCDKVDHLLFMVHGIGSVCDLRLRTVEEVVDEFRSIAQQLIQAHYRSSYDEGKIGRIEVLPVSWYKALHSEDNGIDEKLRSITLESIPRLRNFTNETLLDVLFYTSPIFSQNIVDTVAKALNKKYSMFINRNPNFKGRVSLAGHSLGSLILFDLLCHQKPTEMNEENLENPDEPKSPIIMKKIFMHQPVTRTQSKPIDYHFGLSGTGQALMQYPSLIFDVQNFFALGSPIGMFVTIRGIDKLGLEFRLPTCNSFFNIFHPYDPVAYRIEALVNPELSTVPPSLIPHHKGRKRMHLELKETFQQVSAEVKTKLLTSFRNVTDTVYALNPLNKNINQKAIEKDVEQILNKQLSEEKAEKIESPTIENPRKINLGVLNQGRRFDYVLQEAPFEILNEYLFALSSHMVYWDSADTILFIVKEIYSSMNIEADKEVPQHTLTIERPISRSSTELLVPSTSTT